MILYEAPPPTHTHPPIFVTRKVSAARNSSAVYKSRIHRDYGYDPPNRFQIYSKITNVNISTPPTTPPQISRSAPTIRIGYEFRALRQAVRVDDDSAPPHGFSTLREKVSGGSVVYPRQVVTRAL